MMLHQNKDEFYDFIQTVANRTNIADYILEKDYYISLFLNEIASKQSDIKMYFKGGTALYKIIDEPMRFSEDIDLTVEIRGLSNSQAKKQLETASQKFQSLPRLKGDPMEENNKGSITCVYGYTPAFTTQPDALQRYGKLKVEATSFTVSEPVTQYIVTPLLYKYADDAERALLEQYDCSPISIKTIRLGRMFADKLLASEFYLSRNLFDTAKHIYDICVLTTLPSVQTMLDDDDAFIHYLSYKRIEEQSRIGSDLDCKPLNKLDVFSVVKSPEFEKQFYDMQDIYVFNPEYRLSVSNIVPVMHKLCQTVNNISDKEQDFLKSKEFYELSKAFRQPSKTKFDRTDD